MGGVLVCLLVVALATLAAAADAATDDLDLVSRAAGGTGAKANATSVNPAISADGRFVAFSSNATDVDPADGDVIQDVFVRDLQASATTLISRTSGADGVKGNDTSLDATLSADGRFVAFDVIGLEPRPRRHGRQLGRVRARPAGGTTTLVSRASGASGAKGNGPSFNSVDLGRRALCRLRIHSLQPRPRRRDTTQDVFVRDLRPTRPGSSAAPAAPMAPSGDDASLQPSISADGRFVAFASSASNLDPADGDTSGNVFVRDLAATTTTLVSRASGADGAADNLTPQPRRSPPTGASSPFTRSPRT